MEENEIVHYIARAARKDKFLTEEERAIEGAKIFKRKVIGLWRSQSIKTLEEMAYALYVTGIASSVEEGKKITPLLMGRRVEYKSFKELAFDEIRDGKGNRKYKIYVDDYYDYL